MTTVVFLEAQLPARHEEERSSGGFVKASACASSLPLSLGSGTSSHAIPSTKLVATVCPGLVWMSFGPTGGGEQGAALWGLRFDAWGLGGSQEVPCPPWLCASGSSVGLSLENCIGV